MISAPPESIFLFVTGPSLPPSCDFSGPSVVFREGRVVFTPLEPPTSWAQSASRIRLLTDMTPVSQVKYRHAREGTCF